MRRNPFTFKWVKLKVSTIPRIFPTKVFVKQNLSELDISMVSFCFPYKSLLWCKTLFIKTKHFSWFSFFWCFFFLSELSWNKMPSFWILFYSPILTTFPHTKTWPETQEDISPVLHRPKGHCFPTKTFGWHCLSEGTALLKLGVCKD